MKATIVQLRSSPMQDDIIGKRYGMLTVEAKIENPYPYDMTTYYLCRCDCGGTLKSTKYRLEHGLSTHCGCMKSADLSGQVFGRVTVIRRAEELNATRTRRPYIWECKCECGNIVYRYTDTLKNEDECMCRECAGKYNASMARTGAGFVEGTQISKIRSTKLSKANKSGVKGVSQDSRSGKWRAGIKFKGKSINLGYYDKFTDAVAARKRGEEEYFGSFLEDHG